MYIIIPIIVIGKMKSEFRVWFNTVGNIKC